MKKLINIIKNIIYYLPHVIKDQENDEYFLFYIMYVKLKRLEYFHRNKSYNAYNNEVANQIKLVMDLAYSIYEDKYYYNLYNDFIKKYTEAKIETEENQKSIFDMKFNHPYLTEKEYFEKLDQIDKKAELLKHQDIEKLNNYILNNFKNWWD